MQIGGRVLLMHITYFFQVWHITVAMLPLASSGDSWALPVGDLAARLLEKGILFRSPARAKPYRRARSIV